MSRINGRMKSETMTIVNGWMEVKSLQNDRSLLQKSPIKDLGSNTGLQRFTIVNGWMEVKSLQNDRSLLQQSPIKETIFSNDFLRQPQKAVCSEQVACDARTHTYIHIWGGYG